MKPGKGLFLLPCKDTQVSESCSRGEKPELKKVKFDTMEIDSGAEG
jgi:hypothetical protein